MSNRLDREGVFKAAPISWGVNRSDNSQSIALVVEYKILAQYEGGDWTSWESYEDHTIHGYHYVIKRDGNLNQKTFENLVECIGWGGSFRDTELPPPAVVCQITVAAEEYNGKTTLKVQWINTEDYTPGPSTLPPGELSNLDNRYGSLMRAAASASGKKPAAKKAAPAPKPAAVATAEDDKDDLPF